MAEFYNITQEKVELILAQAKNCREVAVFNGYDLSSIDFSNMEITGVRFICNDLSGTNFDNATLKDCYFVGNKMYKTSFNSSDLNNLFFKDCKLENVSFLHANIYGSDFMAELVNTRFGSATIEVANFKRSTIRNSNFSNAVIKATDFSQTDISHTSFRNTEISKDTYFELTKFGEGIIGLEVYSVSKNGYPTNYLPSIDMLYHSIGYYPEIYVGNLSGFEKFVENMKEGSMKEESKAVYQYFKVVESSFNSSESE